MQDGYDMYGMLPLTIVCQRIKEEMFGTGEYKPDWKKGHDFLPLDLEDGQLPILWTTIECSTCKSQVYFDKMMRRHRCSKCGAGS